MGELLGHAIFADAQVAQGGERLGPRLRHPEQRRVQGVSRVGDSACFGPTVTPYLDALPVVRGDLAQEDEAGTFFNTERTGGDDTKCMEGSVGSENLVEACGKETRN